MKYCVKCGTLLEDSHERCIGCGADVTENGSWSLYPPGMAEKIETEHKETKSRAGLIAALTIVSILLIAAIALFFILNIQRMKDEENELKNNQETEQAVEEVIEESEAEEESLEDDSMIIKELIPENVAGESSEGEVLESDRAIKDSDGKYYNIGALADAGGNQVFSTIYPEDFSEKAANINYEIYSTKYPESLTYIVGNNDGNVQMTFMSPQHYWYRKSDKGQTRSNERDVDDYMQFLTYNGAQGYIEALIKQSYTDLKGFKLKDKEEYSENISEKLTEVSDGHTRELLLDIGDYARIGSDTVYAAMQAECEANIYHYEATSRQGNTIYMDFYVPVVANNLSYVSDRENDKGEVTEWLVTEFVAFEAGNEELYNLYKDDFKLFILNSRLSDEFFFINNAYSKEIETAINSRREPAKFDSEKLKSIHKDYKPSAEISDFTKAVREFLKAEPAGSVKFDGNKTYTALSDAKVGFYSEEKNKVFISKSQDEYPGNDYVELTYQGSSEETSEDSEASSESSESE